MILTSKASSSIRMVQRWITLTGFTGNQTILKIKIVLLSSNLEIWGTKIVTTTTSGLCVNVEIAITGHPRAMQQNYVHNIMPKLCLNPNYEQVLGELSLSARGFLSSSEILRALFCTLVEWHGVINLYILKKITSWRRLKRAHYASKPFDLLEITITFVRQLRKFW